MHPSAASWPLASVLSGLSSEPGRPRLTWYGPAGERIELSGHVLDNWVTKTANLLVEEFGAGPGSSVLVDTPVHWRTVVWAFAVWRTGACVVLPPPSAPGAEGTQSSESTQSTESVDLVVTDRPERFEGLAGTELVAVALPALARRFDGALPRGAVDAASAVMTYGDVLTWLPEADTSRPALVAGGRTVRHDGLLDWAAQEAGGPVHPGERALLEPGPDDVPAVLARSLVTLDLLGSVVLVCPEVVAELDADGERRRRLISTERVTRDQG